MKYDYGDEVIFKGIDGSGTGADMPGAVVSILEVQTSKQAEKFGAPLGAILYTVEFGDGSDRLVPEDQLEPSICGNSS